MHSRTSLLSACHIWVDLKFKNRITLFFSFLSRVASSSFTTMSPPLYGDFVFSVNPTPKLINRLTPASLLPPFRPFLLTALQFLNCHLHSVNAPAPYHGILMGPQYLDMKICLLSNILC